jgi:type VI secretion system secreted protein VgrG
MELTAKAGGSFVKVDAGGVTISGAEVKINTGGAPGVGTPAAPLLPGILKIADVDKPGLPLLALIKQNILFRRTRSGVCEVCEAAKAAKGAAQ